MIKYFRFEWDYVLWGISWANLNMLMATIRNYSTEEKEKEDTDTEVAGLDELADILNIE